MTGIRAIWRSEGLEGEKTRDVADCIVFVCSGLLFNTLAGDDNNNSGGLG